MQFLFFFDGQEMKCQFHKAIHLLFVLHALYSWKMSLLNPGTRSERMSRRRSETPPVPDHISQPQHLKSNQSSEKNKIKNTDSGNLLKVSSERKRRLSVPSLLVDSDTNSSTGNKLVSGPQENFLQKITHTFYSQSSFKCLQLWPPTSWNFWNWTKGSHTMIKYFLSELCVV